MGAIYSEPRPDLGVAEFTLPQSEVPRRCCVDKHSTAEWAIRNAIQAVEAMPADPRLTDAVVLLERAFNKVADYIDNVAGEPVSRSEELAREAAAGAGSPDSEWLVAFLKCKIEQYGREVRDVAARLPEDHAKDVKAGADEEPSPEEAKLRAFSFSLCAKAIREIPLP